ncbi:MAG TPA: DUF6600 domain-containing protein [Anaeromyxobacter sp.]|nr:DUF6600 domain-containing protein [Anaeromyxobacter sp.]
MKLRSLLGALVLVCGIAGPLARADAETAQAAVSFEVFERGLAPLGQWTDAGSYGRVWRPTGVATDWRPYVYGEWVWTVEGWFWSSDEPWAWATYHYGRWVFDPWLGWIWVPGYAWAPAWVAWRVGGGFIGWAPLPPGVIAWWVEPAPIALTYWVFVPAPQFVGHPVHRVVVAPARVPDLVRRTRPAPPRTAHAAPAPAPPRGGPPVRLVEAEIGRPVRPAPIVAVPTPAAARGRNGETVPAFRPGAKAAPAPARARAPAASAAEQRTQRAAPPAPAPKRGEASGSGRSSGAPSTPAPARPAPAPAPEQP